MTDPDTPNEILASVKAAKEQAATVADKVARETRSWPLAKIGLGVGIGSAAVAAAVLFANRPTKK
ncbi:hypothetical protein [Sphingomonas bacterium]|uniref:hypothetical protein n=1 Tax=Sphingomonas bacterium TaxID=1895847 RepID=UPI0015752EE5|nr:hypothetical protein [Sphingomonas bacterium]